jgi:hypothetical protein
MKTRSVFHRMHLLALSRESSVTFKMSLFILKARRQSLRMQVRFTPLSG